MLRTSYGLPRPAICDALERVVDTRQFAIEGRDAVRGALQRFRSGTGDLANYLVGERNRRVGCRTTVTFDRALASSPLFQQL